jgi:hypothetical protein
VTLSGLGATLGVAVTGAIFNGLFADRTITRAADAGVTVDAAQAQQLDGVLAGADGAQRTLDQIAGARAVQVRAGLEDAFVDALGTSLKLSAALIVVGLVLTLVLMRRSTPADAAPVDTPVLATATPRPVPRVVAVSET